LFETVVDVVVDQHLLRRADRLFDGLKLLRDVEAGAAALDHGDDVLEMPSRPLQPLNDLGIGLMTCALGHD
jgi:hypothetical protein